MAWFCRGIWGLLICTPLLLWAEEEAAPPLRFASQPLEGSKILHEQFHGLIGYLQMTLHRPVEMVDYTDLDRLRQAFSRDELDLAYLGPHPAALLEDPDGVLRPLACFRESDGQDRFTCSLIARGGSRVDLATSDRLRIGTPHSSSTCGGLALPEMLRRAGRRADDPGIRLETIDSDADGALGVVRGDYDLAVVKTQVAERYRHLDLQILWDSRPYPLFGLYANGRRLSPERIQRLRQGLLGLDPKGAEAKRLRMDTWGEGLRNGVLPPPLCNTTGLREPVGGLPPATAL